MSWKLQTQTRTVVRRAISITSLFILAVLGVNILQSSSLQVHAQDAKPKDAAECKAWGGEPEYTTIPDFGTNYYSGCKGGTPPKDNAKDAEKEQKEAIEKKSKDEAEEVKNIFSEKKEDICKDSGIDNCEQAVEDAIEQCGKDLSTDADVDREKMIKCISEKTGLDESMLTENLGKEESDSNCNIGDGVGWIVCPAANFLAMITDGAFSFLELFLRYDTLSKDDSRKALEQQWAVMRNIANIAFVIGFLVIVYSQITRGGIANYTIKRLLPRVIVAAILVNLSFWICTLLVDISNILGSSLNSFIRSAIPDTEEAHTWLDVMGLLLGAQVVGGAAVAAVALGSTGALLSFALPVMLSALFSILMIIFILIARQALITILIVVAPLGFIAYLLPNTSKWFERWYGMFISMLLLYPLVSIVFGGSQLAAAIVSLGDEGILNNVGLNVFSLALQAVPLFVVPLLLKSTGGFLGRIGLIANDKTKGLFDRANNKGQQLIARKRNVAAAASLNRQAQIKQGKKPSYARGVRGDLQRMSDRFGGGGSIARQAKANLRQSEAENALGQSLDTYNSAHLSDPDNALKAAGGDPRLAAALRGNAAAKVAKQEEESVDGYMHTISHMSADQAIERLKVNMADPEKMDSVESAALMKHAMQTGDPSQYAGVLSKYGNLQRSTIVSRTAAKTEASNPLMSGSQRSALHNGTLPGSIEDAYIETLRSGGVSMNAMASMDAGKLGFIQTAATASPQVSRAVQATAARTLASPAAANIGKTYSQIEQLAAGLNNDDFGTTEEYFASRPEAVTDAEKALLASRLQQSSNQKASATTGPQQQPPQETPGQSPKTPDGN